MNGIDRRDFLRASTTAAFGLGMPEQLFAQSKQTPGRQGATWDAGSAKRLSCFNFRTGAAARLPTGWI